MDSALEARKKTPLIPHALPEVHLGHLLETENTQQVNNTVLERAGITSMYTLLKQRAGIASMHTLLKQRAGIASKYTLLKQRAGITSMYTLLKQRAGITSMHTLLKQRHLFWLDHVTHTEDGSIPKDFLCGELATGKRPTGIPQLHFEDICKCDLEALASNTDT